MAGFTVANLNQVEDQAPKFGFAPDLEARFAGPSLGLEKSGLSLQRPTAGFRMPFGHKQEAQEEVYVIVGGSGRVKLDDEVMELKTRDAVRVSPETIRAFEAGPDGAEVLVFGAAEHRRPAKPTPRCSPAGGRS